MDSGEQSEIDQANNLDRWYDMIQPKAFVYVMFWFSHHRVHDPAEPLPVPTYFGLLNSDVELDPGEHWTSWDRLRARILAVG